MYCKILMPVLGVGCTFVILEPNPDFNFSQQLSQSTHVERKIKKVILMSMENKNRPGQGVIPRKPCMNG